MTKQSEQSQKLKIREESFGKTTIILEELEPNSKRWKITGFESTDLMDLSKAIEKFLNDQQEGYYSIKIGRLKFNHAYNANEIFHEITNSIPIDDLKKLIL